MALFDRKKTTYESASPYYTIGDTGTLLVIGLGNPGEEYAANRHNIGFMALDAYQATHDFSGWSMKKDLQAMVATGQVGSTRVILAKPSTFMNNSGDAAQKLQKFYRIYNQHTVVIHDELDVDFGTIRSRTGGGSAGHNGIKSLSAQLGEDYGRMRIGIGPKTHDQIDSADFVLQDFSKNEQASIAKILKESCSLLDETTVGQLPEHTIKVI